MARTIKKSPFAFTLTDKRKQYLDHLNIYNDLDVINHLPYRYESFNLVKLTKDLDGKVVSYSCFHHASKEYGNGVFKKDNVMSFGLF